MLTGSDPSVGYVFNLLSEGAGFGVAQSVQEVVTSLLSDGDMIRIPRYGNREVSFVVEITGPSSVSLALGEAALRRQIGRANLLTWTPPDSIAVPSSTFEVVASSMAQRFDDLSELRFRREFTITLTCSPFARSVNPVVVTPLPAGATPTTVVVDTCDSVTGWSGTSSPSSTTTLSTSSGAVHYGITSLPNNGTMTLRRTGSVTFSSTRYLVVEWRITTSSRNNPAMDLGAPTANGVAPVSTMQLDDNYRVSVYELSGTVNTIDFSRQALYSGSFTSSYTFSIREVRRTNQPPTASTPRQLTRIIPGRGTERTPGSIQVSSPTAAALGHTIVHTCPEVGSGYSPPLRRWRVSGNDSGLTSQNTRFSGAYEPIEPNAFVARVPNSSLPVGDYLLAARLYTTAAAVVLVNWSAGTFVNSQFQGGVLGSTPVTFGGAGFYTFPIAVLSLPTVRSLGPVTQIELQTTTADSVTTQIDEGWLFKMGEDCGLTIVENATKNLWLDSPDVATGVPRAWVGDISDRSDARHPASGLRSFGTHIIHPDGTALFTAAEVDNPTASAEFYPRWHSNAAE